MNSLLIAFFLGCAALCAAQSAHDPNYCYAFDAIRPQQSRWADRTSNNAARASSINPNVSQCTPSRFWLYMRHGDRLPSTNDINRMVPFSNTQFPNIINAYNQGRSNLCHPDFVATNTWSWDPNITVSQEQFLTVSGWNIVRNIASRYQAAFPTVLTRTYDRSRFFFRHTDRQRTQATVRAFSDGLFGEGAYRNVIFTEPPFPDNLLRPHDNCPLYDQASNTQAERDRWQNSAEFQTTLTQINDKLGLTGGQRLTARQARTMWELCQFHQLWEPHIDAPFCGAISPFNNLRLEYFEDIDEYYTTGYGLNPVRLAENMGCGIMQDLLNFLTSTNPNEETVKIFSTHQTSFQLFLVTLGVFRDAAPLTAANFAQQANRLWVTSRIAPMATNIAAIRYNCATGGDDVLFLMNEHPLVLPGCQSTGLCKVSHVVTLYNRFLTANCDALFCSVG
ncbi:multiple inositol polyphosphate phosphatase 1-like [Chironomus tepperi]|uniref:multiple inositol polyphosphate phosphatase 1-like n=1 Tax=Chironomus tepperi TaxID=113505 RepID=UPI00391EEFDB